MALAVLMGGVLLMGTACNDVKGGVITGAEGPSATVGTAAVTTPAADAPEATPKASAAALRVSPENGAEDVQPNGALKVEVTSGKLFEVAVTDKTGKKVDGAIAADGLSWKPSTALAVGTAYTVNARAKDAEGLVSAINSGFTTLSPTNKVVVKDNISPGDTYGVGMIVSVTFNKQVKNKDAVLKSVSVVGSDGTTARGHWLLNDRRLDLRPESYWKPGTRVTVKYRLQNVEITPGYYGDKDSEDSFTIGEHRVSTVDAKTHRMTVTTSSGTRTVPISAGTDLNPSWNGKMVIFSRETMTRMNSATVPGVKGEAYDVPDVPHAMKLTTSGTYVHGNYWETRIGKGNYSHGCIGLVDVPGGSKSSPAGKFFAESRIGDVVEIVNSKGQTVKAENGLSGWTLPWSQW